MSGRCVSKSALHYTKIGDAGGVPLQPVSRVDAPMCTMVDLEMFSMMEFFYASCL